MENPAHCFMLSRNCRYLRVPRISGWLFAIPSAIAPARWRCLCLWRAGRHRTRRRSDHFARSVQMRASRLLSNLLRKRSGEVHFDRIPSVEDLHYHSRVWLSRKLLSRSERKGGARRAGHPDSAARVSKIFNALPERNHSPLPNHIVIIDLEAVAMSLDYGNIVLSYE